MSETPSKGPQPSGSDSVLYTVQLTEREMQCVANGLTAFFHYANREKMEINPAQTVALIKVMEKFKAASQAHIVLLNS